MELVIIYTFISTLFYGDIVIGKHTCFCKHPSYRFSHCTINRVWLYPVFSCCSLLLINNNPLNATWCQKWDMAYLASVLQTPAPFPFNSPDEWPKWKRRFEQYRIASGLAKEDDERQVSTLLYCLGEEADDVLTSTNITVESRKKFADVLQEFNEFFKVRKM